MELKQPMSYEEQLNRLITHGIVVADRDRAIDILKRVNYYRFTGYALQFRVGLEDSTYVEDTNFDTVYNLYMVDEKLRDLFRMYIEKAEVYYRTQIAYGFAMNKCTQPPYDQHPSETIQAFRTKGWKYGDKNTERDVCNSLHNSRWIS